MTLTNSRVSTDCPDFLIVSGMCIVEDELEEATFNGHESVYSIENVSAGDCRMPWSWRCESYQRTGETCMSSSLWNGECGKHQCVCPATSEDIVSIHSSTSNRLSFETKITGSRPVTNERQKLKTNGSSQIILLSFPLFAADSHTFKLCSESLKSRFSHDLLQFNSTASLEVIVIVIFYMEDWNVN
jgi:hypothetical protein